MHLPEVLLSTNKNMNGSFSRFIHKFDGLDMIEVNFDGEPSFMEVFDGRDRIILDNL